MTRTILFVHAADEMYGSDAVLLTTVAALAGTEFRARVIVPDDVVSELAPAVRLSGRLAAAGVPVTRMPLAVMRRRYFTPSGGVRLQRLRRASARAVVDAVRGDDVALVHSHTAAVLTGAGVARRLGIPHVWHVSEIVDRPALVRRFIARTVTRSADRVVCVSHAVRDHLLATEPWAAPRCEVIYNGIDPAPFRAADGASVRAELGAAGRPIVGMIGRLGTWKGEELLLEAARRVVRRVPDALFVVVGGVLQGELARLDVLRAAARAMGLERHVVVQGYRTDVAALLAAFDVFVQPSLRPDPFPTTVLEAMASARPVVATAHGGPCEMVVDGVTGVLTRPGDPDDLAAGIGSLLRDPPRRTAMGLAGRERVEREMSLDAFSARYLALYRSLV